MIGVASVTVHPEPLTMITVLALLALLFAILALISRAGPVPWGGIALLLLAIIHCLPLLARLT